jgi:hypothetical protein
LQGKRAQGAGQGRLGTPGTGKPCGQCGQRRSGAWGEHGWRRSACGTPPPHLPRPRPKPRQHGQQIPAKHLGLHYQRLRQQRRRRPAGRGPAHRGSGQRQLRLAALRPLHAARPEGGLAMRRQLEGVGRRRRRLAARHPQLLLLLQLLLHLERLVLLQRRVPIVRPSRLHKRSPVLLQGGQRAAVGGAGEAGQCTGVGLLLLLWRRGLLQLLLLRRQEGSRPFLPLVRALLLPLRWLRAGGATFALASAAAGPLPAAAPAPAALASGLSAAPVVLAGSRAPGPFPAPLGAPASPAAVPPLLAAAATIVPAPVVGPAAAAAASI